MKAAPRRNVEIAVQDGREIFRIEVLDIARKHRDMIVQRLGAIHPYPRHGGQAVS